MARGRGVMVVASLLSLFLFASAGCRTVDDYMADLETIDAGESTSTFDRQTIVFEAGQIIHEALVGIGGAEEMELWQAMRALNKACVILATAQKNALLRADAAVLIGRIASRLPVPPRDRPYGDFPDVYKTSIDQITILSKASEPLRIGGSIDNLESPDESQRQLALDNLRELTAQDFGTNADTWRKWWAAERGAQERKFVEEAREPARILGEVEFRYATQARGVLGILAFFLRQSRDPDFERDYIPAIMSVARQAVVLSLSEAIGDSDLEVRCDVADAMNLIRDRRFGEPLIRQLQRDRDALSIIRIASALRHYPNRRTIVGLLSTLQQDELRIRVTVGQALTEITGEDFGASSEAWTDWWLSKGDPLWP